MAGAGTSYIIRPGQPDEYLATEKSDAIPYRAGDVLLGKSPGGGGWGDPLNRDPEAVRHDVNVGLVSLASAHDDYGVVLMPDETDVHLPGALPQWLVDEAATAARRDEVRETRPPLKKIDRGPRFRKLQAEGYVSLTTSDD
jgi:N-methylhydantoinase B